MLDFIAMRQEEAVVPQGERMGKLLWIFRIVLGLAGIGFGILAMNEVSKAANVRIESNDPDANPKYVNLRGLSPYEIYLTNPEQADAYIAESVSYRSAISAAEMTKIGYKTTRDSHLTLLAFFAAALAVTFMPWATWTNRRVDEIIEFRDAVIPPVVDFVRSKIKPDGVSVIGQENLKRFSTADEMLKWKQLLDQGVVTQDEFDEARRKLLSRGR